MYTISKLQHYGDLSPEGGRGLPQALCFTDAARCQPQTSRWGSDARTILASAQRVFKSELKEGPRTSASFALLTGAKMALRHTLQTPPF